MLGDAKVHTAHGVPTHSQTYSFSSASEQVMERSSSEAAAEQALCEQALWPATVLAAFVLTK